MERRFSGLTCVSEVSDRLPARIAKTKQANHFFQLTRRREPLVVRANADFDFDGRSYYSRDALIIAVVTLPFFAYV